MHNRLRFKIKAIFFYFFIYNKVNIMFFFLKMENKFSPLVLELEHCQLNLLIIFKILVKIR